MKTSSHVRTNTRSRGFKMSCNYSGLKCTKLACIINIRALVLSFVHSLVTTYVRIHIACVRTHALHTSVSRSLNEEAECFVFLLALIRRNPYVHDITVFFCMACVLIERYQRTTWVTSEKTINIMTAGLGTSNLTFLCPQIAAICRKTRVSLKNTTNACVYIPTHRQNIWGFPIQRI
jgi:hypothetical protein